MLNQLTGTYKLNNLYMLVRNISISTQDPSLALDGGNHAGWTPLMYASYHGHPALVAELLSRHADPGRGNNKGR